MFILQNFSLHIVSTLFQDAKYLGKQKQLYYRNEKGKAITLAKHIKIIDKCTLWTVLLSLLFLNDVNDVNKI